MGTITERTRSDGSTAFTAQIRITGDGKVIHSEAKTFNRRSIAEHWLKTREAELASGVTRADPPKPAILHDLLVRYLQDPMLSQTSVRNEQSLRLLQRSILAQRDVYTLTTQDYLNFIKNRLLSVQPQSILQDIVHLQKVLKAAKLVWGLPINIGYIEDAKSFASQQGWIRPSTKRERRPTPEELDMLYGWFNEHTGIHIPMPDIIEFALYSARRLEEITKLRWDDINHEKRTILVRDIKHPKLKSKHQSAKLTIEAYQVIQRQPKKSEYIFPYNPVSIGNRFKLTTKMLGIEDLHFHDLRHEAISRLFERGYAIHEVALFSLHSSWQTLKRYTHLKAEDIEDK